MKVLLAVVNCHTRQAYQDAIRETWLPLVNGADVRFFRGRGATREPLSDEVFLDCGDGYSELPDKVRGIVRWASAQGYDYVCKLDDDVVIRPAQFLSTGQNHDFTGRRNDVRQFPVPFGFAYWLSRFAMQLIADEDHLPNDNNDEAWVTEVLSKANIILHHEPRYVMYVGKREDFVPNKPRALRAPPRTRYIERDVDYSMAVALCMFFNWSGHRCTPDERVIGEMRKVFKEYGTS